MSGSITFFNKSSLTFFFKLGDTSKDVGTNKALLLLLFGRPRVSIIATLLIVLGSEGVLPVDSRCRISQLFELFKALLLFGSRQLFDFFADAVVYQVYT